MRSSSKDIGSLLIFFYRILALKHFLSMFLSNLPPSLAFRQPAFDLKNFYLSYLACSDLTKVFVSYNWRTASISGQITNSFDQEFPNDG